MIDSGSVIIGIGVGLIAEKFFKVTDKIKTAVKTYQKNKKKSQASQTLQRCTDLRSHNIKNLAPESICSNCYKSVKEILGEKNETSS